MQSRRKYFAMLAVALCMAAATVQRAYPQNNSDAAFLGTWNIDLAKSDFGKAPPPKSQKLVITSNSPTSKKWTMETVDADGISHRWSYDGARDGKFRSIGDPEGMTFAFMNDDTIAMKDKSGKVIETGTSTISADGTTLTVRITHHTPDGDVTSTSVYQKAS